MLRRQAEEIALKAQGPDPHSYASNPLGYARDILKIPYLWSRMDDICTAMLAPPNRVLVKAGHKLGKSHLAGILINWFYDSFPQGQLIQIAPTLASVSDVVWKEVRVMRTRARLPDLMPRAPMIWGAADHFAKGMTASSGEAYAGRHGLKRMAIFDEATRIDSVFFETESTMQRPGVDFWVLFLNPIDMTSRAYYESTLTEDDGKGGKRPKWVVVTLDALDHPNVLAEERNEEPPIPGAVTHAQVSGWVSSWCTPINKASKTTDSLEWPRNSGNFYKQGPVMLARARGQWPTSTTDAIWSEAVWNGIKDLDTEPSPLDLPEIGIDVARFGADNTSFHVRWGRTSVLHESYNGWDGPMIIAHAKKLATDWADECTRYRGKNMPVIEPKQIRIKIDEDGLGGIGVVDPLMRDGLQAIGVGAQSKAFSSRYPKLRDELWFQVAERAKKGDVGIGRLPPEVRERLRQQALANGWDLDGAGRACVWPKDTLRELLGRSPDDMDAMNLAYLQGDTFEPGESVQAARSIPVWKGPESRPRRENRKRMFGI